jgi:radical SAM-linked protein
LTFARAAASDSAPGSGRDYVAAWERALEASGLPVVTTDAGRPKLMLAVPLPIGASGRGELLDFWLVERVAAWRVRESLAGNVPDGHEVGALDDVWLGSPALSGRVAAADYRVAVRCGARAEALAMAASTLLAARELPRERAKGGGTKTYDLRPLLIDLTVEEAAERVILRIRTRIHPELGSGRPDEVVAALSEPLGDAIEVLEIVRERLLLVDDLPLD